MVLNHFTPGPGQYKDVNPQEVIVRQSPAIIFGKSSRSMSTSNLIPGRKYLETQRVVTLCQISTTTLQPKVKDLQ